MRRCLSLLGHFKEKAKVIVKSVQIARGDYFKYGINTERSVKIDS